MIQKSIISPIFLFGILAWGITPPAFGAKAEVPDAKSAIASATQALGAANLRTIEFSGSGADYAIGQNYNGASAWPRFNDKTYTRTIDLDAPASSLYTVRTQFSNPPRGGYFQPIFGEEKTTRVVAAGGRGGPALKEELINLLPYSFLRAAAAASDTTVKQQKSGGRQYTVISFTGNNKAPVHGYLNDQNILEKVETKFDYQTIGDTENDTVFSDYKDFGGVKFPTHILNTQAGYPVLELMITEVTPNAPASITAPPGRGGPGGGGGGGAAQADTEKLGDGVFLIRGGYASVAVDMGDHITMVECPQSEARATAIIAAAKQVIPGKPITECVNTHAHFDHSAGIRTFAAEGATIITYETNKAYLEKILRNPHTVVPDRLSQNPRKINFRTVKDRLTLTGGSNTIELYHQEGWGHTDGALLAYLPKLKVLIEADSYNPLAQKPTQTPADINPYFLNLADNIDRLKLEVQRIIPIHLPADNRVITLDELRLFVGKKS